MTSELVCVAVKKIKPYPNNPRHNDAAVKSVMQSIVECGYDNPIVVDEKRVVLAGHTRLKAIQKLGWDDVEVLMIKGLTEEQKRKYRLLDNKVGELASWDFVALASEMDGLDFSEFDLDWGLTSKEDYDAEYTNTEYEMGDFGDETFEFECPHCGFRFNDK